MSDCLSTEYDGKFVSDPVEVIVTIEQEQLKTIPIVSSNGSLGNFEAIIVNFTVMSGNWTLAGKKIVLLALDFIIEVRNYIEFILLLTLSYDMIPSTTIAHFHLCARIIKKFSEQDGTRTTLLRRSVCLQ